MINATTSNGEPSAPWYRRTVPVLALGVAAGALLALFATSQLYPVIDTTLKRWKGPEAEDHSRCFKTLTTASPNTPARAFVFSRGDCFHRESRAIPQRNLDWRNASVAVYSTSAPPHQTPTLRDLGDRGQTEAIKFLEKDSRSKGRAWSALRDALDPSNPRPGERDPFRFDRILIANVAKGIDWKPGDRMTWTRILVQPINFQFAGYSVAATENETLKVTSVERTDSRKFSSDLSATIPGMEGPKVSLQPSSEHTLKTSSDINAQYEKLGIDIMPDFLRIIRESETGGDAVGNTRVSLTVVTDPDMIYRSYPVPASAIYPSASENSGLSDDEPVVLQVTRIHFEDGQSPGERTKINVLPQIPVPHCPLRARVWMLYEKREVQDGRQFYEEWRQSVKLRKHAEDKQDVDIMGADEVSPAVWTLKLCNNYRCPGEEEESCYQCSDEDLKAMVPDKTQKVPQWRKVVFTDYGVAIRLAHWLRTQQDRHPHPSYKFNYPNYRGATYTSLKPFKFKGNECRKDRATEIASPIRAFSKRLATKRQTGNPHARP